MSSIFDVLLILTTIYTIFYAIRITYRTNKQEYFFYSLAVLCYTILFLIPTFFNQFPKISTLFNANLILEWLNISGIAFILSGLALLIYNSKPPFARFPIILCYVPLLIIFTYYFAMNTLVLKEWLLMIYQGGALLVALLMFSMLIKKKLDYLIILMGLIIVSFSFILFWFPTYLSENLRWIWKALLISGMFITVHGFNKVNATDELSDYEFANN